MIVKRLYGIPVVVTAHGADIFSMIRSVFIRLKKYIVDHADQTVTVSTSLAKVLMTDIGSIVHPEVISMGVDATVFSPQKKDGNIRKKYGMHGPFLLYVGRLTEKKGVQYLIDSMSLVAGERPDAKLLIVGHGELEKDLKERVEQRGLQEVVHFVGGLPYGQLPPYYATADIFIGPSIQARGGRYRRVWFDLCGSGNERLFVNWDKIRGDRRYHYGWS